MNPLRRRIYGAIISLHPASFRNQFGRDMALDFDDAVEQRGFAPLLGDAILSLARQWKSRALNGPEPDPDPALELAQLAAGHPFLAGQYLAIDRGSPLNAFDLASASVLSILLLLTIGFAASVPNRHAIADSQSARVSHDGGIDPGHNGPPLAANDARREGPGAGPYLTAPGLGIGPQHGPGHLVRGTAPAGFGPRAFGGPPARPITLVHALVQLILISAVIWITSFLLRRSPGIGRRVVLASLGLLGLAASVAFGQVPTPPTHAQILHPTTPLPSFEVATVKPNDPKVPFFMAPPGSQQIMHSMGPARRLVGNAFGVSTLQLVVGGPNWIDKDTYRIEGKIPDELFSRMQKMTADGREHQGRLMLQSLLADRFKLKVHFETREMPVYELTIAKGGPKLPPPNDPNPPAATPGSTGPARPPEMGGGERVTKDGLQIRNMTLDGMLTAPWFGLSDRPIVNNTGLTSTYNLTLNWLPDIAGRSGSNGVPAAPEDQASIFTALEEQLGLKLVSTKAPVEVVVIDNIEPPSQN